jgi:sugar phosphate isomerase/epimerase
LPLENSTEFLDFIKNVDSDYVKLNFDIGHFYCVMEDPGNLVYRLADYIEHFHLADIATNRVHHHLIPGQGSIDFRSVFKAIIEIGYKGFVTVELYPLSRLTKYASDYGIQLLLEPLNRYSTPYCTTAKEAVRIANQINQDNFGVLLDTFHMNIEEDSIEYAIMDFRRHLRHTHFADNNRKMPGSAHMDFRSIIKSLSTIKYDRYISFEPILTNDRYETATKDGLEAIKALERTII